MDTIIYKKFFPIDGADVKLFTDVVAAINSHPTEDIELLKPGRNYNPNNVKKTFHDVIKIFVTHFGTLNPKPDEPEIKQFPLLFKDRVKPTTTINGMSPDETVDCISNFIVNQITNDSDTLRSIITEQSKDSQTIYGIGNWKGGRRSRRNSSSTRRRPRRGKSAATKPRRRPRRRTARK